MKIKGVLIFIICAMVYCIPMGLVLNISNDEKKKYIEDDDFDFSISAYGNVKQVEKMDMNEYYLLDATVTCIDEHKMTFGNEDDIYVESGEEVHETQPIAYSGGREIYSDFNGLITEVEYGEYTVVHYQDFNDLVYELYVDENKYDIFDGKELKDKNGNELKILQKSNMLEDGKFKLYLSVSDKSGLMYGKEITGFELHTGTVYKNSLVVPKDCVYKKGEQYYIRTVDEQGIYLDDVEVSVGYENEEYICVTGEGIEEGTFCDSGYSKVEEGIDEESEY